MGRKVAMLWHASFSIGAGFLFFYFVLPRWTELVGETSHTLGTALRIAAGVLIGLAALPVVFTLLRTRKPELGTPQLALSIRTWSIVAHVLAGVLIIGTAISEIWLSLDAAGHWLFGIYGAAAAIAVLGFFAFYLSFVAELPPPPPKPIKAKKPKKRDTRRQTDDHVIDAADEADETETDVADDGAAAEVDETEEAETSETEAAETPDETPVAEDTPAGLQNRRPTGKGSHRMRRKRSPGAVAVEE
jgi:MFS family permease